MRENLNCTQRPQGLFYSVQSARVLDEPYSQLTPLSGVAVPAPQST
jgi:hypothetical protein